MHQHLNPLRAVCTAIALLALAFVSVASAQQVRINEIAAATSDRLLKWDANGQPSVGPYIPWFAADFDDSGWLQGGTPIGFGLGDEVTDLGLAMSGKHSTFYQRYTFQADAALASSTDPLKLDIEFDDGWIVFINGKEVERLQAAAPGLYVHVDEVSFGGQSSPSTQTFDLDSADNLLVEGENTLCVQVINERIVNTGGNNPSWGGRLTCRPHLFVDDIPQTSLVSQGDTCRYFVGICEPTGGVFDAGVTDPEIGDWLELHNGSGSAVDISDWALTDDAGVWNKWTFPTGTTIGAGEYLVVMVDAADTLGDYHHTNFSLSSGGEYLGLYNATGSVVHEVSFPEQSYFHSYGLAGDIPSPTLQYMELPTPGVANVATGLAAIVEKPEFSIPTGHHAAAIDVAMTTSTPGASIYFTVDGSVPSVSNGTLFTVPLPVVPGSTVAFRAVATKPGHIDSLPATGTFIVGAHARISHLTSISMVGQETRAFYRPHGVTSNQGGIYNSGWTATSMTDYNLVMRRGRAYERPISFEFLPAPAEGGGGTQIDSGVRMGAGNFSRKRFLFARHTGLGIWGHNKGSRYKPNFNLFFRGDYGRTTLEEQAIPKLENEVYDSLRLRAGHNDTSDPFIADEFTRRTFAETGQVSAVGMLVAMHCNGEYKGFYNVCPRIDGRFLQESHGGGSEWDIIKRGSIEEGDPAAFDALTAFLKSNDMTDPAVYATVGTMLDIDNFIDYLLMMMYGGESDWPNNNWIAARERVPGAKIRFYTWDSEYTMDTERIFQQAQFRLETVPINSSFARNKSIPAFYDALYQNDEFKLRWADRVQKHFYNGGALSEPEVTARWQELSDEINPIRIHTFGQAIATDVLTDFIPQREAVMIGMWEIRDLWPSVHAPEFSQHGGTFENSLALSMTNPNADGVIYYTVDGTDPRQVGGAVSASAVDFDDEAPVIDLPQMVIARVRAADGTWSPSQEANFSPSDPGTIPFRVTEVHYHPADPAMPNENAADVAGEGGDAFEYLELHNFGSTAFSLDGVMITDGVTFDFSGGDVTVVPPGGYVLVVSKRGPFLARYGAALEPLIAGEYDGRLKNSGETIRVELNGAVVQEFTYDDGWYPDTDGDGLSLEIVDETADPALWSQASAWVASVLPNGSPGVAQSLTNLCALPLPGVVINELMYRPPGGAEPIAEEFIELHNASAVAVDISGWRFSDGVDYTFPATTTIDADSYLVVAADVVSFSAKYPTVTNVIGGWTGKLSNSGEGVELANALGDRIDKVRYADEGDWATRTRGPLQQNHSGWVWTNAADGDGKSLELRNPAMPRKLGTNWGVSIADGGSPGAANSLLSADIAPVVAKVKHSPEIPSSSDLVTVTCSVTDEAAGVTAKLHYRRDGEQVFRAVAMFDSGYCDEGEREFSGTLPAQVDGTIVEFYVSAKDAAGQTRTWPAPVASSGLQEANALYQVDDNFAGATEFCPFVSHRIVMTAAEREEYRLMGTVHTGSDAQMNSTFITFDGDTVQVRYLVGVRNRGQGSRSNDPNNFRINLRSDDRWNDRESVILNAKRPHLQVAGSRICKLVGLHPSDAAFAEVRLNGERQLPDHGYYAQARILRRRLHRAALP